MGEGIWGLINTNMPTFYVKRFLIYLNFVYNEKKYSMSYGFIFCCDNKELYDSLSSKKMIWAALHVYTRIAHIFTKE